MLRANNAWRCTWACALSLILCFLWSLCVPVSRQQHWAGSSCVKQTSEKGFRERSCKAEIPFKAAVRPFCWFLTTRWPPVKQRPLSSQLPLGFKRRKKGQRHFPLLPPPSLIPSASAGYTAGSTSDINKYKSLGAQHQQFQCSEALEVQSLMQKSEATTVYSKLLRLIRQPWRIISREDLDQWQRQSGGALFTGLEQWLELK